MVAITFYYPPNSKIYSHSFEENHPIMYMKISKLLPVPKKHHRVLESILIHDFKACLNYQQSFYDLNILGSFSIN